MQCEYWTCSAGSGDLVLASKELEIFKQLPSASRTTSAKLSSESTGPKSRSLTTLEPSQQIDLEELISSAEGSPVNRGPLPGSSEAQKMTVTSGRSWLPLLKSYGLNGSLAKMCEDLLTNRWVSSAAFLTWKASGIKPSHLLFQLAPSMPRTDATGSGLWRTPNAGDGERGTYATKEAMENRLERGSQLSLPNQVKHPHLWPTPRSCSAMAAENIQNRANDKFPNLESVVARAMWPTPTTRDHKGGRKPDTLEASGRGETNSLNDAVTIRDQHGALNPEWVEWLQGFPLGWTNLTSDELQPESKTEPQD